MARPFYQNIETEVSNKKDICWFIICVDIQSYIDLLFDNFCNDLVILYSYTYINVVFQTYATQQCSVEMW